MKKMRTAVLMLCLILTALSVALCEAGGEGPWTVTQFGSDEGSQKMFYTITNAEGGFVVIDGGFRADAPAVMEEIHKHGDHLDAWIITHPHEDHVGAFLAIMEDEALAGSFSVDRIYGTPVNEERYRETARDYDGFAFAEEYLRLIEKMTNVTKLYENDQLDLIGLHMKVLSAWDANVDALPDHLCNNGSLMFMLSGRSERMLFCSDVQSEMEAFILEKHGGELKADYVQLGHHGNWGLTKEFYALTGAEKGVFADAPARILDDTTGRYDGPVLKEWWIGLGIPCYRFTTAPNTIVLH